MRVGSFSEGFVNAWSPFLGPVVLAPDVQHEDASDEEQRHHQDGDGATKINNSENKSAVHEGKLYTVNITKDSKGLF